MKSLNTVIEVLESCQNDAIECFECPMRHETECEVKSVALEYLKEYQSAKDDLDEKRLKYMNAIAEFEDNPVLTWEQLKTMKGKPVWVEYESCNRKVWAIVDCFYTDAFQKVKMNVALPHDYWNLEKEMMGVTWQAYRKEPIQ